MTLLSNDRLLQARREAVRPLAAVLVTLALTLVGGLLYLLFGEAILTAAHAGRSVDYLNKIVAWLAVKDARFADVAYLLARLNAFALRAFFLALLTQGLLAALLVYRPRLFRDFFQAETHPANLAIFRFALFGALLTTVSPTQVLWYSGLPADLRVIPPGLALFVDLVPITPEWAAWAIRLVYLFGGMAMLGLWSRTSAVLAVVLGLYVLGIPQLYGKINHYHHLIWFGALLAASPCGDALSIDALVGRWRGRLVPGPSRAYALPLRLTWLLIGVIYFFPGFWKMAFSGLDWALSDNLRFKMYTSWLNYEGWSPLFRLDQYPLLYRLGALATIAFELLFIFAVLVPGWRRVAVAGGLLFHLATQAFMGIFFSSLVACYVAFVDWHRIGVRLAERFFGAWQPAGRIKTAISRSRTSAVLAVGGVLLVVNGLCGFLIIDSWPFGVYPTFATIARPIVPAVVLRVEGADGAVLREINLLTDATPAQSAFSSVRLRILVERLLALPDPAQQQARLTSLARQFIASDPSLNTGTDVALYRVYLHVEPDRRGEEAERDLLFRATL